MSDGMAADAEREFEVYEQRIAELREHLSHSCSLTEYDRVSADLARALPVVEAAGALVERREAGPTFCAPDFADLLDALARAYRAARESRTGEQG